MGRVVAGILAWAAGPCIVTHGWWLALTVAGQRRTPARSGHRLPRRRPLHPGMRPPPPMSRLAA